MQRRSPSGFTLVELSIASAVLVVMSAVIVQSLRGLTTTQASVHGQAKVSSLAERVGARIESDVSLATRVFSEGDEARAFLAALDLAALTEEHGPLPGSRMPVATLTGVFEPDPADAVETGNLLLLVRRDGVATVDSTPEVAGPPLPSAPRRIDLFRFVVWYLHDGSVDGIDLSRWSSVRLARLQDIEAVADPVRRAVVVKGLGGSGVTMAWDPGAVAAGAFHTLDEDGVVAPLATATLISVDLAASEAGVLSKRHVGIAGNGRGAMIVPRFARAVAGFPNGFELKRDGNGSGDLLLLRMVVTTPVDPLRVVSQAEVVRQTAFRED